MSGPAAGDAVKRPRGRPAIGPRIQCSFPADVFAGLVAEAEERGVPVALVIRETVVAARSAS